MLSFLSLKLLFKKCYCSRLLLPKRLIPLNVSTCQREPEKKFRHQRDSNPGLSDTSWALYQLSYEAARWGRRVFRLRKDCQLIRFQNFNLLHHFSGLFIVLLLLVGYLIFGIIALACFLLYCLCGCLESDRDDWEMDHINGLSTEMNLYWINIPLSIAFSLNVLYLNNMGFHLFEFGTLEQIYFGSVRST